jgi:hypothetical protein
MDARQAILVKVVPTSFHLMFLVMSVSGPQLGLLGNHAYKVVLTAYSYYGL